jgi:hypothetical protein
MSIRRRLKKLEKDTNLAKSIPKRDCIAFVSTYGLDEAEVEAKIRKIEQEYLHKYGTTDGMVLFISAMPEPDPPPDESDTDACISGAEHLIQG